VAYGGSQARGLIRAVAINLRHSHSNSGSEPHLRPTPQLTATPDPQPIERGQGLNPQWFLVGFISDAPQWELPKVCGTLDAMKAKLQNCLSNHPLGISTFFFLGESSHTVPLYYKLCSQFPTFGEIAGVRTPGVHWESLALRKPSSSSRYLPCQVSI